MAYEDPEGVLLRQSDLLENISTFVVHGISDNDGNTQIDGLLFKRTYSLVLTQDCDLEQDFAARFGSEVAEDKKLFGMILCGVYPEDLIKAGAHKPKAQKFSSKEWKVVARNGVPRYQYLGYVPHAEQKLVADFKDYFVVPGDFLYQALQNEENEAHRLASIQTPYREYIMQRFAGYLMRIGLPTQFHHLSEATT